LARAHSFAKPPSLELSGARFEAEPYSPERRAICLSAESQTVLITIRPAVSCVNPVFEFSATPGELVRVELSDRALQPGQFAWDGQVLWLNTEIREPTPLRLEFADNVVGGNETPAKP